ncbi:MAG: type I secretion system permease/ATPase [Woeseia sp.]
MTQETSKSGYSSWNPFLRACLQLHRGSFIAVIVFSFVINLLMLTVPLYLLQIFNRVVPSKSTDTLLFLTGIVVVAMITMTILEGARRYIFVQVGAWMDSRLGGLVLSGSITRSVQSCRKTSAQALKQLATIRRVFSESALFPVLDAPWTPIFLFVLFMLHPLIGLISLLGAIALLVVALINERSTRGLISEANVAASNATNYATTVLRNADVVEAMGMRHNIVQDWESRHGPAVYMKSKTSMRGNRIASIATFIRMMLQIIVIAVAGLLVLNDQMSAGALIASVLLMRRAVSPMDHAISSWKLIVRARNAFSRVSDRIDFASELKSSTVLPMPNGHLSIRHASFKYPRASKPTLLDITFKVQPGEIIGIAGDTAAGKSTLGRLLVGLAAPESGYVRMGGVDLVKWSSEERGPFIGYLPQDTELFSGSIRQNIARMTDGDFSQVVDAARLVGLHETIMQFPDSYDTQIGENGAYLSGGQRQRVALARAIYGNPRLIVLDEPDSFLDTEGQAALAGAMQTMKHIGAMIILISHQHSVLECADRLLILRNGKINAPDEKKLKSIGVSKLVGNANPTVIDVDPGEED